MEPSQITVHDMISVTLSRVTFHMIYYPCVFNGINISPRFFHSMYDTGSEPSHRVDKFASES